MAIGIGPTAQHFSLQIGKPVGQKCILCRFILKFLESSIVESGRECCSISSLAKKASLRQRKYSSWRYEIILDG
jgi:hypothetical protein